MPSEKKMWMGYEYMPNMYRKTDDGYVAKDELRQDTEDQVSKMPTDQKEAYERAVAKKRAFNPPPLVPGTVRYEQTIRKAEMIAERMRGGQAN